MVTALPVVALVLPVVLLLLPALGLSLIAAPLVLAALLAAVLLSLLEPLPSRRALTVGMLATAVAGAGTLVVGTALDGYSADEPRPVSLGYVLESDTSKATWVSDGDTSQTAVGKLLTDDPTRYDDGIPPLGDAVLANGVAKAAPLDAPRTANVSSTEADGVRTVRVRIQAPADAHTIAVHAGDRRPPDPRRHSRGREAHRRAQAPGGQLGLEFQLRRPARRGHRRRHPHPRQGPPATARRVNRHAACRTESARPPWPRTRAGRAGPRSPDRPSSYGPSGSDRVA